MNALRQRLADINGNDFDANPSLVSGISIDLVHKLEYSWHKNNSAKSLLSVKSSSGGTPKRAPSLKEADAPTVKRRENRSDSAMGCCGPSRAKEIRHVLCLPLAGAVLMASCAVIAWSIFDTWICLTDARFPNLVTGFSLALAVALGIVGVTGICSVMLLWVDGAKLLIPGFRFSIIAFTVDLLISWTTWTMDLCGAGEQEPWHPDSSQVAAMIVTTLFCLSLLFFSWWILASIKSFYLVLLHGGTGWEFKCYRDFKMEMLNEDESDVSSITDLDSLD